MWVLGRRPELRAALRKEALDTKPRTKFELHSMPLLASVLFEVGRLYPPLSQLANRVTFEATLLGGKYHVAKGQWVGWNSYGVHTDTNIWGSDALEFNPQRWGNDVEAIDKCFDAVRTIARTSRGMHTQGSAWESPSRVCNVRWCYVRWLEEYHGLSTHRTSISSSTYVMKTSFFKPFADSLRDLYYRLATSQ